MVLQFLFQNDIQYDIQGRANREEPSDMSGVDTSQVGAYRHFTCRQYTHTTHSCSEDHETEEAIAIFWENFKTDGTLWPFFSQLVMGVMENREEIDGVVEGASENWKVSRMAIVDRNILRFSVFEILYLDDIPPSVTMNEAIEIAKRYGTEDSPAFINGILDKVALKRTVNDGN